MYLKCKICNKGEALSFSCSRYCYLIEMFRYIYSPYFRRSCENWSVVITRCFWTTRCVRIAPSGRGDSSERDFGRPRLLGLSRWIYSIAVGLRYFRLDFNKGVSHYIKWIEKNFSFYTNWCRRFYVNKKVHSWNCTRGWIGHVYFKF